MDRCSSNFHWANMIVPQCRCTPFEESFPGELEAVTDVYKEQERFHEDNAPSYTPRLSPLRFFHRVYGKLIYHPLRRWWNWYTHCCFVKQKDHFNGGQWVRRFTTADTVKDWVSSTRWLPRIVRDLVWGGGWDCPKCGSENFRESMNNCHDDKDRPLFECVDDGTSSNPEWGTYHWWEGWLWCYYCGHCEWVSESSA
jgi:hypothetical protein